MKMTSILPGLLVLTAGVAQAEEDALVTGPSPFTERVPYAAAELNSEKGVQGLKVRVRQAAHRVCAPSAETFMMMYNEMSCYSPTVKDAFAQIDRAIDLGSSGAPLSGASVVVTAR